MTKLSNFIGRVALNAPSIMLSISGGIDFSNGNMAHGGPKLLLAAVGMVSSSVLFGQLRMYRRAMLRTTRSDADIKELQKMGIAATSEHLVREDKNIRRINIDGETGEFPFE